MSRYFLKPVCDKLYQFHKDNLQKGVYFLCDGDLGEYDSFSLSKHHKEHIDKVLEDYGDKTPFQLGEMVHAELPWIEARNGLPLGERGGGIISGKTMGEFYADTLANLSEL
jgi:uncharacterized phage-associated protein